MTTPVGNTYSWQVYSTCFTVSHISAYASDMFSGNPKKHIHLFYHIYPSSSMPQHTELLQITCALPLLIELFHIAHVSWGKKKTNKNPSIKVLLKFMSICYKLWFLKLKTMHLRCGSWNYCSVKLRHNTFLIVYISCFLRARFYSLLILTMWSLKALHVFHRNCCLALPLPILENNFLT